MKTSIKIFFYSFLLFTFNIHIVYSQLVSDFRVNDDTTNTEQFSAKIGVDSLGNFIVVWRDRRNGRSNIFCQRFNSSGFFLGSNFRINENPDSSTLSDIAVSKSGKFVVTWLDVNNVNLIVTKVKCRFYNSDGVALTDEILINDTLGSITTGPSISVSKTNEYTITWEQKNILFQRLDSLGNKIGSNIKVNDDTGVNQHQNPAITVRQDGSFIITWQDSRPPSIESSEDIYMQIFSKNGNPIGNNIKVSDDTVLLNKQSYPKISSDSSGRFCISFTDFNLNEVQSDIMCQLYNQDGSRFGNNITIAGNIIDEYNAAIYKKENGDMVSGFIFDNGLRYVSNFQRITSSGFLLGTKILVSSQKAFSDKFYNDLAVWGDRIISIWQDNRNGNYDIYCNIRSFTNPDSTVSIQNISLETPSEFKLYQNYPNPFNNQTNIVFEVVRKNNYILEIYNTLGRVVDKFNYNNLNPGKYNITYDASGLSSGVYYYSMNYGGFNSVKKFILVK